MIAIKDTQLRDDFKNICDRVAGGDTVIVLRPNNKNVVMISEAVYKDLVETLNICSVPGMKGKIMEGLHTPIENCLSEAEADLFEAQKERAAGYVGRSGDDVVASMKDIIGKIAVEEPHG